MNKKLTPVLKNCGNFSSRVLPGLIAYGREKEREGVHRQPHPNSEPGDGYATREQDLKLGGFLHAKCAAEARQRGMNLSECSIEQKQKIALSICNKHIAQYGTIGLENYSHWLKRITSFSRHHKVQLPVQGSDESPYRYARRIRKWTMDRPEKWPVMQKAVGTHLVFSPDPQIWNTVREAGGDEREFLKTVITKTMKEVQDWRREFQGSDGSLGWIAGTHVRDNGADRHPHIHVIVLKRDSQGKEVDWSVSSLRGHRGREKEPDPIRETKRLFEKHVNKEYSKICERENHRCQHRSENQDRPIRSLKPVILTRIRTLARVVFPGSQGPSNSELGALMRLVKLYRSQHQHTHGYVEQNLPSLVGFKTWLEKQFPNTKTQSLEPGD